MFESAQMVKEHITTHLTDLPFPCDRCDYSFETQEQLEEHELKHAEMEYEDQIEKEVLSEALQTDKRKDEDDDVTENEELEEGEMMVTEYTIPDISKPDIVVRLAGSSSKQSKASRIFNLNEQHSQGFILDQNEDLIQTQTVDVQSEKNRSDKNVDDGNDGTMEEYRFLKDEVLSDPEDNEMGQQRIGKSLIIYHHKKSDKSVLDDREEVPKEEIMEPIKPIVRQEGTKVYQRKIPLGRKASEPAQERQECQETSIRLSSLQNSTQRKVSVANATKTLNAQIAQKTVRRVQKFIITKDEMKNMAKQGKSKHHITYFQVLVCINELERVKRSDSQAKL